MAAAEHVANLSGAAKERHAATLPALASFLVLLDCLTPVAPRKVCPGGNTASRTPDSFSDRSRGCKIGLRDGKISRYVVVSNLSFRYPKNQTCLLGLFGYDAELIV